MARRRDQARSARADTEASFQNAEEKNRSAVKQHKPAKPFFENDEKLNDKIFKLLSNHSSVCLGLTCKKLYKFHRRIHPEILKLSEAPDFYDRGTTDPPLPKPLHVLLGGWMGPDWTYFTLAERFLDSFLFAPVDHSNDQMMSLEELDECLDGFWDNDEAEKKECLKVTRRSKRQHR